MKNSNIDHPFYKEIDREITRIKTNSNRYRIGYYSIRIGMILIAAIITIISGWKPTFENPGVNTLNILLLLGTLSTLVTTIDSLFQIETKNNTYKLMLFELREIRSELTYHLSTHNVQQLDEIIEKRLFSRYQSVMSYSKSLIEKEKETGTNYNEPG